jgi:hypothetical protein
MLPIKTLSDVNFDQFCYIMLDLKPQTTLTHLGWYNYDNYQVLEDMTKARHRVVNQYGDDMRGLMSDATNIQSIACSCGWPSDDSAWMGVIKTSGKAKRKADTQGPLPSVVPTCNSHILI